MGEHKKKEKMRIPPISRYPSRKEWEIAVWEMIMRSPGAFRVVITPSERHDFVMRVAVIEGIRSGKSYREIGDELWCSPQTISGIKKALREEHYRSYWERGKTERKKKVYSKNSFHGTMREPRRRARGPYTGSIQLSGITRTHYPKPMR